uniref:Uncharacterized protein n=1 Tax=Corethron hystrix TaxID=216773 RepID=A0A7S1FT95_9STRA|mmetsp:Transcript_29950/g.68731  ORF Transcript_29950/g.68731 Transcript_29950/m.68731 type:complete len:594 (+) Transcript_29950:150-1931(+)
MAQQHPPHSAFVKTAASPTSRDRFLSIRYDADRFLRLLLNSQLDVPLFANERAGSWYAHAASLSSVQRVRSCYFKSTDGHCGTWNFSLKRLNLHVVDVLASSPSGACFLVDASARKIMPDSISRTIPMWACVLNRIVFRYRNEMAAVASEAASAADEEEGVAPKGREDVEGEDWDMELHLPPHVVGEEERKAMISVVEERVRSLYDSGAVVNPARLVATMRLPLRPFWVVHGDEERLGDRVVNMNKILRREDCLAVVCISCSNFGLARQQISPPESLSATQPFQYVPGASDDHELWSRGLDPIVFRDNADKILCEDNAGLEINLDDVIKARIDKAVAAAASHRDGEDGSSSRCYDPIGGTGIFVGTRRSGRPPLCWTMFDAILNVTNVEYDDMTTAATIPRNKFYLQMPVAEGKRDRNDLERYMAAGLAFVSIHVSAGRRVLVHCAQGRDRSVAVVIACIVTLCELQDPLILRPKVKDLTYVNLCQFMFGKYQDDLDGENKEMCSQSGLSEALMTKLVGRPGRKLVLEWMEKSLGLQRINDECLANKETLRIALHLVVQHREVASPTRSTMQKLNRFFMSEVHELLENKVNLG